MKAIALFFLFFKKSYIFCNLNLGASQKVISNEFATQRKKGVFFDKFFLAVENFKISFILRMLRLGEARKIISHFVSSSSKISEKLKKIYFFGILKKKIYEYNRRGVAKKA
jgi:hypothetical protein